MDVDARLATWQSEMEVQYVARTGLAQQAQGAREEAMRVHR